MSVRKGQLSGDRNGNWRGGRTVASTGYILVRVGVEHPLADIRGYVYEHRLVAAKTLGRELLSSEHVHHKDGDKTNNDPENLEVLSAAEHRFEHRSNDGLRRPGEGNPSVSCACGCGKAFQKYDSTGRPRQYVNGHNRVSSPAADAILSALNDGPHHRTTVRERCGSSMHAVATCLSKLKQAGRVRNVGHGIWERIDKGGDPEEWPEDIRVREMPNVEAELKVESA